LKKYTCQPIAASNAPRVEENMSVSDKKSHIKRKDTSIAFSANSEFDPVLDNLRVTKQERDLLNFLLPSSPASVPERRVKRIDSRTETAKSQFSNQARSMNKSIGHYYHSPETSETPPSVDSPPRAFGVLMDIADIDQAWKSWAGTS
jgi:hypothetical protein